MNMLTIGKIAKASETSIETIRYYEKEGLLVRAKRSPSGYRMYDERDILRLRFIRRAKELGFTLSEITELLKLRDQHAKKKPVLKLAKDKLATIESKITSLQRVKQALEKLTTTCSHNNDDGPCPLLSALDDRED